MHITHAQCSWNAYNIVWFFVSSWIINFKNISPENWRQGLGLYLNCQTVSISVDYILITLVLLYWLCVQLLILLSFLEWMIWNTCLYSVYATTVHVIFRFTPGQGVGVLLAGGCLIELKRQWGVTALWDHCLQDERCGGQ